MALAQETQVTLIELGTVMNDNPYRSPNTAEAEPTKAQSKRKERSETAAFGFAGGASCFLLCTNSLGIVFVNVAPDTVSPNALRLAFLGAVLVSCLAGTIAASWFPRASERQRKAANVILSVSIVGMLVLLFLLPSLLL
jgi:hypothetical protein